MFSNSFRLRITRMLIKVFRKTPRLLISDTTLRDGEQSPGASLTVEQKCRIAKSLEQLGVDSIDVGFPASSESEIKAAQEIAKIVKRPVLTGLSRCNNKDIDAVYQGLSHARRWGIALFIGTSPVLRKYSLHKSKDEIIEKIEKSVRYAAKYTQNITFGAEDATRTEMDFLCQAYQVAIDNGALVIGFTDTVGYCTPDEIKQKIETIQSRVKNIKHALIGVHFHNDLGLAVANSLAAVEAGAHLVQCTVNGVGERAGNAALEEVVMSLKTRKDYYRRSVNIQTNKLVALSNLVVQEMQMPVSAFKPIVGKNVFATEAGIHQAALLESLDTYEIIKPEDVGQKGVSLVLGKHSGQHALHARLEELGYDLSRDVFDAVYQEFKKYAEAKKEITDLDLKQLVQSITKE